MGNLLGWVRSAKPGKKPVVLLDAHLDEIGMVVTYIEESGFLRAAACGGIDRRVLPAAAVTVHTKGGRLCGVVCSTPPHLAGPEEKKYQKVEELYIDIGLTRAEAEAAVSPGDVITLAARPRRLLGDVCSGKALDDRAGCVAILRALELLRDEELDCGLTAVFSSMEETGMQGAATAAYALAPTHAVAVDVTFAHTPDSQRHKTGLPGKGPMVGFAPVLPAELSKRLCELAEAGGIPYQREAMGGSSGTNADAIAVAGGGVAAGLLSIPQRYMHTPVEVVCAADIDDTGRLLAALVRDLAAKGGEAR
jgi:endoglucanase